MRPESFAAGVLAVYLLTCPVIAETNLPRLQPAEPVFAKHAIKSRPSICNGVAGNGATIEHTVQTTFIDPLIVIAEDLARLFRPFFSDEATTEEAPRRSRPAHKIRRQPPSNMVRMAERKRLCG